jgi:hypothetical protein
MTDIEIFTSTGALRRDFSEDEISALPEERKIRFFEMVKATTDKEDAQAELTNALADEHASAIAMQAAVDADRKARPPRTFLDEHRAAIAARAANPDAY